MFRIGEFSKLTQVSIRMLRYYDEAGILTPAEVDKWTGHLSLIHIQYAPHFNCHDDIAITLDKKALNQSANS